MTKADSSLSSIYVLLSLLKLLIDHLFLSHVSIPAWLSLNFLPWEISHACLFSLPLSEIFRPSVWLSLRLFVSLSHVASVTVTLSRVFFSFLSANLIKGFISTVLRLSTSFLPSLVLCLGCLDAALTPDSYLISRTCVARWVLSGVSAWSCVWV